jgi:hypothetical protein
MAKLVWQKGTCACGFFIDSVSLHEGSIHKEMMYLNRHGREMKTEH